MVNSTLVFPVVGTKIESNILFLSLLAVPTPQSDSSSTNTVVIIGSVLGSLLLLSLIAVILMCLFCKVCCCKRSAKVNTELNNNTKVTKKQKIQEKAVEKPDIVMLQETYVPVGKEKGLLENKTGDDLCLKKTTQEGLDVSDNDKVEESHKTRKEVQHSDIVIEEDLLITRKFDSSKYDPILHYLQNIHMQNEKSPEVDMANLLCFFVSTILSEHYVRHRKKYPRSQGLLTSTISN